MYTQITKKTLNRRTSPGYRKPAATTMSCRKIALADRTSWEIGRTKGMALVECLMAAVISTIVLLAMMQMISIQYRACTETENQTLAANIAQEIIDNARNVEYTSLTSLVGSGVGSTTTQDVPLYTTSPTSTIFQRPALENRSDPSMVYSNASLHSNFNAGANNSVQVTLTRLAADSLNYTGELELAVLIKWTDTLGNHSYQTSTTISESGIHN